MKKLNFLALGAAMAAVLFAFTACDPANDTENPGGDNTGEWGGNGDDVRLVDKITITGDGYSYDYQLSYDDKNRVTKLEEFYDDDKEGEYVTITYSYGAKTLTLNYEENNYNDYYLDEGEEPYWEKWSSTYVFNIDSEGRVVSVASGYYKEWENDELVDEGEEEGNAVFSYEDGYIKNTSQQYSGSEDYGDGVAREYTGSWEVDFSWTGGNLTKVNDTETTNYVDEAYEDYVYASENTYTYGTQDNPKVSFDLNALETLNSEWLFIEALGFFGKSPAKLVSSRSRSSDSGEYTYVTEYDWTLDSEGYITKMTDEDENGDIRTITVTYKK